MKIAKLVTGIISIILCLLVTFQSCAAGLSNTLNGTGEVSGSAGIFLAILMLTGGIVFIASRNSTGKSGSIAAAILYIIAAIIGMTSAGSFSDLKIWAVWCLLCGVLAILSIVLKKKAK